jgi:hypothetical protein
MYCIAFWWAIGKAETCSSCYLHSKRIVILGGRKWDVRDTKSILVWIVMKNNSVKRKIFTRHCKQSVRQIVYGLGEK